MSIYSSGEYLRNNPAWHAQDSAWKARKIIDLLQRHRITPKTVCDVGCGAGEILVRLQDEMADDCQFAGYDVSADAIRLALPKANDRLRFEVRDVSIDHPPLADVVLAIDVIEHVEDYLGFLRRIRERGVHKVFHIPLDLSAQAVLRPSRLLKVRRDVGHLHYFTRETALQSLVDTGYEVLDWSYTATALDLPVGSRLASVARFPRKMLFSVSPDVAVSLLGGFSLMVLAR